MALKNLGLMAPLCLALLTSPIGAAAQGDIAASPQDERAQLQGQLDNIQAEINQLQSQLDGIKGQKSTLQSRIKQLKAQQAQLNLQIKAATLQIAALDDQIASSTESMEQNTATAEQLRRQMSQVLRLIEARDGYSPLYAVLADGSLAEAAAEAQSYRALTQNLGQLLSQTKSVAEQLQQQAEDLAQQQDQVQNLLSIKTLQQHQLNGSVKEQSDLLSQTKGRESAYQASLATTKKQAEAIRTRLYQLLGVSNQITFGEAVQIAQQVSGQTGVRAAFILAILTQESNLGKNVGTCNRAGDPPEKGWRVVMKPDRDQAPFQQITSELSIDPDTTPISCPMKDRRGKQVGWGGAMGPAQFIPSTWMGWRARVTAITGRTANPWDIRDAFLASALKLKSDGAGTVDGEWAAAMRYFSGGTSTRYRFYGDNVVATANQYQRDIDELD